MVTILGQLLVAGLTVRIAQSDKRLSYDQIRGQQLIAGRTESEQTPLSRIRIGGSGPSSRPNSSPYWELELVPGRHRAAPVGLCCPADPARPDKDRNSGGPQLVSQLDVDYLFRR